MGLTLMPGRTLKNVCNRWHGLFGAGGYPHHYPAGFLKMAELVDHLAVRAHMHDGKKA